MEYEKKSGNFSFGFGCTKTAGSGTLDKAVEAPKVNTAKYKTTVAKNAAMTVAGLASWALKRKYFGKNHKKKK
ncbi:MAG: hypothetical protein K6G20_12580 [Ruminococcus sp.]|nr:hypothetical protein [Ruminococcus sp.]MCR5731175.1 hypothetical protein [Ruminococcus sp.]